MNTNDTGMPKLSTVYLQALVGFSRAPQNLSQSPCMFGILAPYPPISTGGSHGLVPGCLDVDNPAMTVSMMPSWLCVDNDEQPWSVDNDTIDIMMPLDSLDTICLDLSLYCIYIIASNEDMSTTFLHNSHTVYTVEAPHPSIYSIERVLDIVQEWPMVGYRIFMVLGAL